MSLYNVFAHLDVIFHIHHWTDLYVFSESSSLDEDWEKDFDIEVTEEDLRLAQEAAKKIGTTGGKDEVY